MIKIWIGIVLRDLRLSFRQGADAALVVVFFVLAALLFPFGVGPEPSLLARIGPGVVWATALLAALLAADRLFLADYEDGGLDLFALSPLPLEASVLAKVAAHWLATGLPLVAAAPLVALFFGVDPSVVPVLLLALLLGTPVLSLIGAIGAALTLGARRGGALMPLLVLPLYIPVLIFGAAASEAALAGLSARPYVMVLGAMLLAAIPLAPVAAGAALRHALD